MRFPMRMRTRTRMRLRLRFEDFSGLEGTPENLLEILDTIPQVDTNGDISYLIGGGWGVEILTSLPREHHDIDVVILDETIPYNFRTDNRKPEDYFSIICTDSQDIRTNHTTPHHWEYGKRDVYTPGCEFLLVSKVCEGFGREPRDKDYEDAGRILQTQDLDPERLRFVFEKTETSNIEECVSALIEINQRYRSQESVDSHDLIRVHKSILRY